MDPNNSDEGYPKRSTALDAAMATFDLREMTLLHFAPQDLIAATNTNKAWKDRNVCWSWAAATVSLE